MARIPDSIGKYKVISEIARGGMGAVYKAAHPTLDRFVIIKKLTMRGNASVRERFRREASIMMDFRNEYIVDVFDHFREGPAYYIVQEFVDGMSLAELLVRERYLPERVALLIFRDCCYALKYAHDRGVVHRDIKPANILISRKGDVKLVDFGIAHVDDENENALTREGTTLGTPSYMAPEQFQDTRSVDKRADIYSLGVMLYEMVTGRRPFPGSISAETLRLIQHGKYRKPKKQNPAISRFTARMIRKTMHSRRKRRYQELSQVLKKIERRVGSRTELADKAQVADRLELASVLGRTWAPPKYRSRARRAIPAVLIALLLVLGGGAYYARQRGLQYEYLYPDSYGALSVVVKIPRAERPASATNISARLFDNRGDTLEPAPDVHLAFAEDTRQTTGETAVYVSNRAFLPAGNYRLEISAAGQLSWRDFFLESRSRQQSAGDRSQGRIVTVSITPERALPLITSLRVASLDDGSDITNGTNVSILSNGLWTPFFPGSPPPLTTGSKYQFRLEQEGYYPAHLTVHVLPFQTRLSIQAALVPYPGAISISSAAGQLSMTVNGEKTYRSWGRTPHPEAVPVIGSKSRQLVLAPGQYTIEIRRGAVTSRRTVRVRALRRLDIQVERGTSAESLRFQLSDYRNAPELVR